MFAHTPRNVCVFDWGRHSARPEIWEVGKRVDVIYSDLYVGHCFSTMQQQRFIRPTGIHHTARGFYRNILWSGCGGCGCFSAARLADGLNISAV